MRRLIAVLVIPSLLVLSGCEGTETRNRVDDSVEELAGKRQVERMKEMKKNLEDIQSQQAQRIDQMKDAQ
jgi:outer membrane murein-binding lipoprotein Lpp